MNKNLSWVFLIIGVVLIFWGVGSSNSLSSDVSEFFTGSPDNKTMWLLISGLLIGVVGFFGVFRQRD